MTLQTWLDEMADQYGQQPDERKVGKYLGWTVLQQWQGNGFDGRDWWPGKEVVQWCMVGYANKQWKSIGLYFSRKKLTAIVKIDPYNREWIQSNGIPIVKSYSGNITLRQLHYRLVSMDMPNSFQHYKRVVGAMIEARWEGAADFDDFVDRDRDTKGKTEYEETDVESAVEEAKDSIRFWMRYYRKNRWENQRYYIEVWIEKKALQGVFEGPCGDNDVLLAPCKGSPSLTYLYDGMLRLNNARQEGKECIILYFGDYDPTGEDIPRSIEENIHRMGFGEFELKRCALMEDQVVEMGLPIAPTKASDSRTASWDGLGQVELDAIEPKTLARMCNEAIMEYFDTDLWSDLQDTEREERDDYKAQLVEFVQEMGDESRDDD